MYRSKFILLFLVFLCATPALAGVVSLAEVEGWQAGPADFLHYRGAYGRAFYVTRVYQRDGARIQLFLAGGAEGEKFQHLLSGRLEVETKDYFLKYFQDGNYRLLISHSRPEKKGFMAVFLNEKPVIILFARYQGLSAEEIRTWLKHFDWDQLKQESLAELKD